MRTWQRQKKLTIGYIQPLADAEDKLSKLIAQTTELKKQSKQFDLIIWPEVPVDFSWYDNEHERYRIRKLAKELDSHLIILSGYHYVNKIKLVRVSQTKARAFF